jgi:hypothetical protein
VSEVVLSFDQGSGFSSGAIEYYSGPWSHVDNVTPKGLLGARSDRVGGQPAGVWPRPPGYQKSLRGQARVSLPCSAGQYQRWLDFLYAQVGKRYDKLAIFAFIIERDWRDESAWFCSELAARALEVAGILPPLSLTPNKIAPGALALAVSAAGGKV